MWAAIDTGLICDIARRLERTGDEITRILRRVGPLLDQAGQGRIRPEPWWWEKAAELNRLACSVESPAGEQASHGRLVVSPGEQRVAAYFATLPPEVAEALVAGHPDRFGSLDGVPLGLRIEANRLLAVQYRDRLEHERASLLGEGAHRSNRSPAGRGPERRLEVLDRLLAEARGWASEARSFLVFDPSGDGRIVEVLGNLDTAEHLAVLVPGVGNGLHNFDESLRPAAGALLAAASELKGDLAVVAWLGYDAPDHLLDGAAGRTAALHGAAALGGFLRGVSAAQGPEVHLTVIGHSYGSLVAGLASREGLPLDDLVFVGSPGVGAEHVSQLRLDGRVWVGLAGSDPIRLARAVECFDPIPVCVPSIDRLIHGTDPAGPRFGARRFSVGETTIDTAHSGYFRPGSVGLRNLARITLGEDDRVAAP